MQDEEVRLEVARQALQKRMEKVTPELLSQFMFERGVPVVKCMLCHSNDIGIPQAAKLTEAGPRGSVYTYVRYVTLDTDGPRMALDNFEYRLICNNCGFTSHIAVYPVLRWIEAKEKKDE